MLGQKRIEGFWLSEWSRQQRTWVMLRLFRHIQKLMAAGVLTTEIAHSFALDDIRAAVQQAALAGRPGKVLLRIGPV
jgi:NADPH:quinone reductase-like Zn-dependent oxidoreductase